MTDRADRRHRRRELVPGIRRPRGRWFVADQAEALLATGAARPFVDHLRRDPADRRRPLAGTPGGGRCCRNASARLGRSIRSSSRTGSRRRSGLRSRGWRSRMARHQEREQSTRRSTGQSSSGGRGAPRAGGAGRGIVHAHTVYPDGAAAAALRRGLGLAVRDHRAQLVHRARSSLRLARRRCTRLRSRRRRRSSPSARCSRASSGRRSRTSPTAFHVLPNSVPVDLFRARAAGGANAGRAAVRRVPQGVERDREPAPRRRRGSGDAARDHAAAPRSLAGRATEAGWRALAASLGIAEAVGLRGARRPAAASPTRWRGRRCSFARARARRSASSRSRHSRRDAGGRDRFRRRYRDPRRRGRAARRDRPDRRSGSARPRDRRDAGAAGGLRPGRAAGVGRAAIRLDLRRGARCWSNTASCSAAAPPATSAATPSPDDPSQWRDRRRGAGPRARGTAVRAAAGNRSASR